MASQQFALGAPKRGLPVRCAATKELKPLRKSLERKQKEIMDVTAALQSSTCLDTPLALHGMVLHLQRLGCEAEALVYQAEAALAMEEAPVVEELDLPTPTLPAEPALPPQPISAAPLIEAGRSGGATSSEAMVEEAAGLAEVLAEMPEGAVIAELESKLQEMDEPFEGSGPPRVAVASLLPQSGQLWEEVRSTVGDSQEAAISVCQGKACSKAGSAGVLQDLEGIAGITAGLEVATTKCMDRCKQGPTLAVSTAGSGPQICVSKEKPPKKQKKLRSLVAV